MAKTQRQKLLDGHDVDASTGCWQWGGATYGAGYGRVSAKGGNRYELAHRESYREFVGAIPNGMCVCHSCDNRKCINPSHLWLGTHADNANDMVRKNRSLVGSRHHNAKLTEELVLRIRNDNREHREIAADYGVSYGLVGHIKRRLVWRHVS